MDVAFELFMVPTGKIDDAEFQSLFLWMLLLNKLKPN